MSPRFEASDDPSHETVQELFKTLIATSGIMLSLLLAFAQRGIPHASLWWAKVSAVVFLVSLLLSLLGIQFIVAQLQRRASPNSSTFTKLPTQELTVAGSFFVAWFSFLVACSFLLIAILYL